MSREKDISDEYLNALVDGQLATADQEEALQALNGDADLRERLCELRALKQLVQHAYPQESEVSLRRRRLGFPSAWWPQSLAASLVMLMIGGMAGWLVHDWKEPVSDNQMMSALRAMQHNDFEPRQASYIVHVDTDNPIRLKTALDEAESLLSTHHKGQPPQVEIVANGPGLNLLREGISPYAQRISEMQEKYPNLTMMACGQTIRKLQEGGAMIELLPHTKIAPSALEQIISRRLKQHWAYIKV